MRKKIIAILLILMLSSISCPINAEEENEYVDMNNWTFIMLTKKSDQDKNVVVSKYYNVLDDDIYAFCIEPDQRFTLYESTYTRRVNDDNYIYQIVKAYDSIGRDDDNYFIAAQLLIWEQINGISYTFNGEDYSEYKEELINFAFPLMANILLSENNINEETAQFESYVGDKLSIKQDFTDYQAFGEGIEILSNDENGLTCVINKDEPVIKTLEFTPIINDEDNSFIYESENSQDLYIHEGEYFNKKPFSLSLKTLKKPEAFDIHYSKKDINSNSIAGAEFSLYQINPEENDDEIIFIQNNIDIDIFEAIIGEPITNNLRIETSERFDRYINGNIINTDEIGYFPYKIFNEDEVIKEGIVFVTNDLNLTNGTWKKSSVTRIFRGFSEDLDINSINNVPYNFDYYLCESEPKNGYEYASEPCVLIEPNNYEGETIEFINNNRNYTLKLMKESPEEILLNGAKFKISYENNGKNEEIIFVTGALLINRDNDLKYLFFKHESDEIINKIEFDGDYFQLEGAKPGKYYYYESDSEIINFSSLYENEINVMEGGFTIENLPYSSSLTIEELVAPKGYIITEPIYHITPDIKYSEITFKNYRVNTLDVVPAKFIIPTTCVDE